MYVCICNAVTESQIRQAIAEGATTLASLKARLSVATDCGCCEQQAVRAIQEYLLEIPANSLAPAKPAIPHHNTI